MSLGLERKMLAAGDIVWSSKRNLEFNPDGRCIARFPAEFPLRIHFHNARAYCQPPNFHDYLEIFVVYKGRGLFRFGKKAYEFGMGDILVVGSNELHNCERCDDDGTKTIEIYFMPELIYDPRGSLEDLCYLLPFYNHDDKFAHRVPYGKVNFEDVAQQIMSIYRELSTQGPYFRLAAKNQLKNLLLTLSRCYERSNSNANGFEGRFAKAERLSTVMEYIKNHYQESLKMRSLAQLTSMTPEYFCRFFKKATGLTFTAYIARLRVARAKELLEKASTSITEVAYEIGFENYSYFHRTFKVLTGLSPREYRLKLSHSALT